MIHKFYQVKKSSFYEKQPFFSFLIVIIPQSDFIEWLEIHHKPFFRCEKYCLTKNPIWLNFKLDHVSCSWVIFLTSVGRRITYDTHTRTHTHSPKSSLKHILQCVKCKKTKFRTLWKFWLNSKRSPQHELLSCIFNAQVMLEYVCVLHTNAALHSLCFAYRPQFTVMLVLNAEH